MRLLKPILTAALMTFIGIFSASAVTDQLRLTFADGHSVVIALRDVGNEHTKMFTTPEGITFSVPSEKEGEAPTTYTFDVSELQAVTSIEGESSEQSKIGEIADATDNVTITPIAANTLLIAGSEIKSAADIRVYDLNGRRVMADISGTGNEYILSIAPLQAGIYLINVGKTTIKVTKR